MRSILGGVKRTVFRTAVTLIVLALLLSGVLFTFNLLIAAAIITGLVLRGLRR